MASERQYRVCIVAGHIGAFGVIGGFGTMARRTAAGLKARGVDVCAVVPRRKEQGKIETLDGFTVYGIPKWAAFFSIGPYRAANADIYHSIEPTFGTYLAQLARPRAKHVVTFIDPRSSEDWAVEIAHVKGKRRYIYPLIRWYDDCVFVRKAARRCNAAFAQTKHVIDKAMSIYGLTARPEFVGNPVTIPKTIPRKSSQPTVCFLARWDRRKRPEIFFELAKRRPDVKFIAVGRAHDPQWDAHLRATYGSVPNLEMPGFVDPFTSDRLDHVLESSWILINTASREGLPSAFIEALGWRCAILAAVNPDDFAGQFGYHVADDDFDKGLAHLLEGDRWRQAGERGYQYVLQNYDEEPVIRKHMETYERLLFGLARG